MISIAVMKEVVNLYTTINIKELNEIIFHTFFPQKMITVNMKGKILNIGCCHRLE
jgi:hypothetical protein